jgi:hypothetical protein
MVCPTPGFRSSCACHLQLLHRLTRGISRFCSRVLQVPFMVELMLLVVSQNKAYVILDNADVLGYVMPTVKLHRIIRVDVHSHVIMSNNTIRIRC